MPNPFGDQYRPAGLTPDGPDAQRRPKKPWSTPRVIESELQNTEKEFSSLENTRHEHSFGPSS
jgi:hypothetical protein